MVLRTTLCAHCRGQAAAETCVHCGSAVCPGCARDDSTCPVPRVRTLHLEHGQRLRRVDPAGRVGLVAKPGSEDLDVFDLVSGEQSATPCRVPALEEPYLSGIAQGGRVLWLDQGEPTPAAEPPAKRGLARWLSPLRTRPAPGPEIIAYHGLVVGSLDTGATRSIQPLRPTRPRALGLCPSGRYAWMRTVAETVQVWDLETGAQHEYHPFTGSVLQAVALDSARSILASVAHGLVNVLRLEGARVTQLELLHLLGMSSPWIALWQTCMAVAMELRDDQSSPGICVFALDADGVPEPKPFLVAPFVMDMNALGVRLLQRPVVASLSEDGRYLAAAMHDQRIAVYDLQRRRTQYLRGHAARIAMISFTTGARSLVTADHGARVILWPRPDDVFLDRAPDRYR